MDKYAYDVLLGQQLHMGAGLVGMVESLLRNDVLPKHHREQAQRYVDGWNAVSVKMHAALELS